MTHDDLISAWESLPPGAKSSFEQQWIGITAGGLPCGSAIVDTTGKVIASGRNHSYDPAGELKSRIISPLQHTRLAHAELNALAHVPTDRDHHHLTLWSTQHPCSMCAAAISFVGIGAVCYVADDLSDDSSQEAIISSHGGVPYQALGNPLWWTISNLLFLYNVALQQGERAANIRKNRERYPELVSLTLSLARENRIGKAARGGISLPLALGSSTEGLARAVATAPR